MHLFRPFAVPRARTRSHGWRYYAVLAVSLLLLAWIAADCLAWLRLVTAFLVANAQLALGRFPLIGWSAWNVPGRWAGVQRDPQVLILTNTIDAGVLLVVVLLAVLVWWKRLPYRTTTAYGAARWPTRLDCLPLWDRPQMPHVSRVVLAAIALLAPRMHGGKAHRRPGWIVRLERHMRQVKAAQPPRESVFPLGSYRGMRVRLPIQWAYEMVLIIGVSGVGKTLRLLMPAILAQFGRMSWVALDPKGEIRDALQETMVGRMETWLVDPRDPGARHFNPLEHITDVVGAQKLARIFVEQSGGKPPWDQYAAQVITLLILHLRATEPHAPFSRLIDAAIAITYTQIKGLVARSSAPEVQRLGKPWLERMANHPELCNAVLSNVTRAFQDYDIPLLAQWTASDELPLRDLAQRPVGLILAIADIDQTALQPVVVFLFDALFEILIEEAMQQPDRRLPHGCLLYLDEFGNVGKVPAFPHFITQARARRIGLVLALQSFAQLDMIYGRAIQQIILDGCRTKVLFGGAGEAERRAFSRVLGTHGAITYGMTESPRDRTIQLREVQQPLMDEHQLFNLPAGAAVVVTGRVPAFVTTLPKVTEDPRLRHWAHVPPAP